MSIKNWLLKPYPFPSSLKDKILTSLGFGNFVFLFLILFKPFNFSQLENNTVYFALIYGLITLSIILFNLLIIPKIFNLNNWNIYKMLLFLIEVIIFIGVANTIFSRQVNEFFTKKEYDYLFFIVNTFLIGIFPIFIYIYISEKIASKKHQILAQKIATIHNTQPKTVNDVEVILNGENKNEQLPILLEKILYISYEKNYVSVFYLHNEHVKETLLRTSLNKIENQLSSYKSIVRCHKSYIVNTSNVITIKGNARSYLLQIKNIDLLIPVSRSFPKELLFTLVK